MATTVIYAGTPEAFSEKTGKIYVAKQSKSWASESFQVVDPTNLSQDQEEWSMIGLADETQKEKTSKETWKKVRAAVTGSGNGGVVVMDLASPMGLLLACSAWEDKGVGAMLKEVIKTVVLVLPEPYTGTVPVEKGSGVCLSAANVLGATYGTLVCIAFLLTKPSTRIAVVPRSKYYDMAYNEDANQGMPRAVQWAMASCAKLDGSLSRLVGPWTRLVDEALIATNDMFWAKRAYAHIYCACGSENSRYQIQGGETCLAEMREDLEQKRFEWQLAPDFEGLMEKQMTGNVEHICQNDWLPDKIYLFVGARGKKLLDACGFECSPLVIGDVKSKLEKGNRPEIVVVVDPSDAEAMKAWYMDRENKSPTGLVEHFPSTVVAVLTLLPAMENGPGWANFGFVMQDVLESCSLGIVGSFNDGEDKKRHNEKIIGFTKLFFSMGNKLRTVGLHVSPFPRIKIGVGYYETGAKAEKMQSIIDQDAYSELEQSAQWLFAYSAFSGESHDLNKCLASQATPGCKPLKFEAPAPWWIASCVGGTAATGRATFAVGGAIEGAWAKATEALCFSKEGSVFEKFPDEADEVMANLSDYQSELSQYSECEWETGRTYDPAAAAGVSFEATLETFKKNDKDGNGIISADELTGLMKDIMPDFTADDVKEMLADADTNKDGAVDYVEFLKWVFK